MTPETLDRTLRSPAPGVRGRAALRRRGPASPGSTAAPCPPRRLDPLATTAALAAAALCLLSAGCGSAKPAGPSQPPPVPVLVAEAQQQDVPLELKSIGRIESSSTVEVRSQVEGAVQSVLFKEGQTVGKGQPLFLIDKRPFQAALSGAEAQLASDRAQARNAEADVARYEELAKKDKDYVTGQQMELLRSTADAARERVKADEAAVDLAKLRLSWCTIAAPIPGRVGTILVHAGNTVKANEAPMVVLLQTKPVYATFSVPERFLPAIQRRRAASALEVLASPPDSADAGRAGTLTFLDNTVDTATGTIQLKAEFPNEDEALWPGQFVEVVLRLETQAGAVVVPSQAVQTGQQGDYIFVVKTDGSVESRPVTVARTFGDKAVIEKGISPGEKVVTDGQLRLVPGAAVTIKEGLAEPGGSRS